MPLQSENDRVINRCGPIFSPQLNGISTSFLALRLNLILYSLRYSDKTRRAPDQPWTAAMCQLLSALSGCPHADASAASWQRLAVGAEGLQQ